MFSKQTHRKISKFSRNGKNEISEQYLFLKKFLSERFNIASVVCYYFWDIGILL